MFETKKKCASTWPGKLICELPFLSLVSRLRKEYKRGRQNKYGCRKTARKRDARHMNCEQSQLRVNDHSFSFFALFPLSIHNCILKTNHNINCDQTFWFFFLLKTNAQEITFFPPFHSELKVFIAETDADEDSNCEIKEDGVPFELSGFAFALPKNSSWNHQISRAIHKLNAHDTIPNIFLKWTTSRCKISQQTVVAHRMGLDEFGGFLFNTAMICCGCFILMLAEILVYRKITRTRRSFSPQQNGVVVLNNAVTLPESSSMTSILNN